MNGKEYREKKEACSTSPTAEALDFSSITNVTARGNTQKSR